MINKVLFISLFVFVLVIISYLYLCYPMSLDLANYLNTYLKIEYGTSKDVLISFIILGFPVYLYHKLGHIIMSLFFCSLPYILSYPTNGMSHNCQKHSSYSNFIRL